MATSTHYESEFDEAYNAYSSDWGQLHNEMKRDIEISLGDQWDSKDKSYLKSQRREALVFNKVRRIIKAISGYQRNNRHSLRVDPVEGSDQMTAELFSALLLYNTAKQNGYHLISDAFEKGPLTSGLNMVEIAMNYQEDMVNGDVGWIRHDFNSVMFDINMRDRTMSDCDAVLHRTLVTKPRLAQLLPTINVDEFGEPSTIVSKFPYMNQGIRTRHNSVLYTYDRMWTRTTRQHTVLIDKSNGQGVSWNGDEQRLREWFDMMGVTEEQIAVVKRAKSTVELRVYANNMHVWTGPDPVKLDDYPWVPFLGFHTPEAEKPELRIQGIVRCDRDPQDEINKRRSKMLDIIDSQISSGWVAREDAVKNKEQMYQSGQGKVIWISSDVAMPIGDLIKENRPADIPQGLFTLTELMDRDVVEIPGFNNELLGMPDTRDTEVAAILAKLRQSSGLTVLTDLFDGLEISQKLLGTKTIKAFQRNYLPWKVERITGKPPTKEFYDKQFGKYDCNVVEGLLTDTQRQHYYAQLLAMKKMGAEVIPWSAIIESWPLEGKSKLIEQIQKAEQAAAQQNAENQKLNQMQMMLNQSLMMANMAKVKERLTQAQENKTSAMYDRVKSIKDIQKIDTDNLTNLINTLQALRETQPAITDGGTQ